MLFSSYAFILAFLPIVFVAYRAIIGWGRLPVALLLLAASIFFYGYWNAAYVGLLIASMAFNYVMGELIGRNQDNDKARKALLVGGIAANILLLVYYKYLFPIMGAMHGWGLTFLPDASIVLPLGISFFTFTQIGYLVDASQGSAKERSPVNYGLFVTFFPHLIAGPIVHHKEMMPQFADPQTYRFKSENVAVGLTLFILGLFKKVVIADRIAVPADALFNAPNIGALSTISVWAGVLGYALQIYFDFSGYSDMAVGLARIFGIRFPANFNSPFKAASIIDYWQRWHMSLTRYLTLYLYNPISMWVSERRMAKGLGITKKSWKTFDGFASLVAFPTLTTMIIIGVWHGAGLQYLVFGALHGSLLVINHAWRIFGPANKLSPEAAAKPTILAMPHYVLLTHAVIVIGFVFFRAPDLSAAMDVFRGLLGIHNVPDSALVSAAGSGLANPSLARQIADAAFAVLAYAGLYAVVFLAPNTQEIMARFSPVIGSKPPAVDKPYHWQPNLAWSLLTGALFMVTLLSLSDSQKFLYFQF